MELSVVIPAWNEADNLGRLLPQLHTVLSDLVDEYEVIVVDNQSPDATEQVCTAAGADLVQQTEPGYGGALWAGFERASGEYVLTMDVDLSHGPGIIPAMWGHRSDADLVVASRYVEGGSSEMPRYRHMLSIILNVVYSRVLSLPVKDVSSGFRLYRASALSGLDLRCNGFDALEEILIKCHAGSCKIVEVPFRCALRGSGTSKVKLLQFSVSYLTTLIRMWKLRRSSVPNA